MKIVLFLFILNLLPLTHASEKNLNCVFPNQTEDMVLGDCAVKNKDGGFRILKPALAKIKFDTQGLAGGSISGEGCYWLNSKGLLRKTHCFDNGADSFAEGFARYIDERGNFGYMDQHLKIKILPAYTFAFPFESGQAKVCQNCTTEKIRPSSEYSVVTGGNWSLINKKGKVIKQCPKAKKVDECV